MYVKPLNDAVHIEEHPELLEVIQGGDVLILGNRGMGKTLLAQQLERRCVWEGHHMCVLDYFGSWNSPRISADRRIIRWRNGELSESGYLDAMTTVWDYRRVGVPRNAICLEGFDDVIVDDWDALKFPYLHTSGPRRIVIAQILDDALERHTWDFVFVFRLCFEREIAFARNYGGQALSQLGFGNALLITPGVPAYPLGWQARST